MYAYYVKLIHMYVLHVCITLPHNVSATRYTVERCLMDNLYQVDLYIKDTSLLRQHSSQQIIDWDPISLGFLVYIDAVCRL